MIDGLLELVLWTIAFELSVVERGYPLVFELSVAFRLKASVFNASGRLALGSNTLGYGLRFS